MRASAVDLRWSPTGEALLALASAEPDAANKSYYGDSKLHYLRSDGSKDCLVPLPKEGPVHDVAWSPRGDCFVALAGFMPPRAVVFDARCAPSLDLGSGPFCHARWSPHHGRFLVLAGFGNLAGDLAFYARKADGKLKPCGSARAAGGVSLEWSPDSRLLLVSTTAPRLRVDNGVRVFSWDGALVASRPWEVLLEAAWRPAGKGVFPDRPPSPRVAAGAGAASAPSSSASASSAASAPAAARPAAAAAPVRPTAFVPPHLRGRGAPPPRAAKLSLGADDDGDGGGVVVGAAPRKITGDSFDMASVKACFSKTRLPPGAEAILESGGSNKAAAKNAKRRAAAAAKKKAAEEGGG
jgi:translation initiation factor 2A